MNKTNAKIRKSQTKIRKSPAKIVELVEKETRAITRRRGGPSFTKAQEDRLSQANVRLSSTSETRYTKQYVEFFCLLEPKCGTVMYRLCQAIIRANWLYASTKEDIPNLAEEVCEAEKKEIFKNPALKAAVEPPIRHSLPWSLPGITACLGEKFAQATACCEGRLVDMLFPVWDIVGCVIMLLLTKDEAEDLAQALSGATVRAMDDGSTSSRRVSGTRTRFRCDVIESVLGERLWKCIEAAPIRQAELEHGIREHTEGVSVDTSAECAWLRLSVSTSAGTAILETLRNLE